MSQPPADPPEIRDRTALVWGCVLVGIFLVAVRGGTLDLTAIQDTTESRYVEVSRAMARSGDFLTPRLHMWGVQEPYLGKPPLHFWLTAFSFRIFGIHEWAARMPSFLEGLLVLGLTLGFVRRFWGTGPGLLAAVILASSSMFLVLMGVCMIGMTLTAAMTGAMVSFAGFAGAKRPGRRRLWGHVFFLCLAIGLLAKGPVAPVLAALSLGIWAAWQREWRCVASLPWGTGILLVGVVAGPWYVLAEVKNPGFLKYFLLNEHLLRFLVSDYGDQYGRGHEYLYGAAWPMLAVTFLPWTGYFLGLLVQCRGRADNRIGGETRKWERYVLVWGLVPALFFTFSRNLVPSYFLPGFPALAVWVAVGLHRWKTSGSGTSLRHWVRWHAPVPGLALAFILGAGVHLGAGPASTWLAALLLLGAGIVGLRVFLRPEGWGGVLLPAASAPFLLLAAILNWTPLLDGSFSTRRILHGKAAADRTVSITFPYGVPASANFYAPGQVKHQVAEGLGPLQAELSDGKPDLFILKEKRWNRLPEEIRQRLKPLQRVEDWILLEEVPLTPLP